MCGAGVEGPRTPPQPLTTSFMGLFLLLLLKHYFRVLQNVARLLLGFQFFSFKVQIE